MFAVRGVLQFEEINKLGLKVDIPTNCTLEGPTVRAEKNRMTVDYDCEADDGSVTLGQIIFEEVLAYRFWDNSCCTADSIVSPSEIRVLEVSDYLAEIILRWSESVGWQDWQKQKGGCNRFRHFTLYFDDVGSIDVVASACIIGK